MTEKNGEHLFRDPDVFNLNRSNYPVEELARYENEWVAWSLDGSRIVAHDADLLRVNEIVRAAGLTTTDVIVEQIPPGGEVGTLL